MTDDRHDAVPDRTPPPATGDDGIWVALRRLTAARIGLQRTGASLATGPLLDFQLAHARARDAVHEPLDEARLIADLAGLECPVLAIASAAEQQALVAREVDENLVTIRDLSTQTAAGATQTSAASQELSRLAVDLNALVTRFVI